MKNFLQNLVHSNFPPPCHAFGYGSAVFKQANYNISKPNEVIDIILIVNDAKQFHEQNMSINYSHYSGISKRLPPFITSNIV